MAIQKPQNANASVISVTTTAANLFDLINTAGSTTLANAGFVNPNGVIINCEDGSIRVASGVTPTTAKGKLLATGPHILTGLEDLNLISTSGTVSCSVLILN